MNQIKAVAEKIYSALSNEKHILYIQNLLAALTSSFLFSSLIVLVVAKTPYTSIDFVKGYKPLVFLLIFAVTFAILMFLNYVFSSNSITVLSLITFAVAFSIALGLQKSKDIWFGVGIAIVVLIIALWAAAHWNMTSLKGLSNWQVVLICTVALFLIFTVTMSAITIYRYRSFSSSCFDFGIFAQMFDYMKTTGLPLTTVERNKLLSHFAVHFSPFFYVLLPGYMLFSTPEYLLCAQAIFVAGGVFAVYGICKHLGFSPFQTLAVSVIYTFYPSMSFGCLYDFHENKFLSVLVLFTFYFMLKRKWIPFFVSALLLCGVKEDAAIYVVAVALFMIVNQKLFKFGGITLAAALVYFVFALKMTQVLGGTEGEFSYRYSSFTIDNKSGVGVILKTLATDIGFAFAEMFKQEKFQFILWMFLPVMFSPFMTKKISSLLLITPMLIVNMLSSWPYQYDVGFQYTYGTGALIMICAILALKDMSYQRKTAVILASAMISVALTVPHIATQAKYYGKLYPAERAKYDTAAESLRENLPKDATICAMGYIVPHLYDYKSVYQYSYTGEDEIEYFVVDTRDAKSSEECIKTAVSKNCRLYYESEFIKIYKRQ